MNLDTRARRAADGLRASTGGVDPMAQITELKREDETRRRTSRAAAVLGGVVVLAGAGWLALAQLGGSGDEAPQPMSSPDVVVTSPPTLTPGQVVGAGLPIPLKAKAPAEWSVSSDRSYVWLDSDGEPYGMSIQMGGPIVGVYDADQNKGVDFPAGGYEAWLVKHPSLTLLNARSVDIDGKTVMALTFKVAADAPKAPGYGGVLLGRNAGITRGQPWDEVARGDVFTYVLINLDGKTMVVKAVGAKTEAQQAELDAALDLVLSTMRLPD